MLCERCVFFEHCIFCEPCSYNLNVKVLFNFEYLTVINIICRGTNSKRISLGQFQRRILQTSRTLKYWAKNKVWTHLTCSYICCKFNTCNSMETLVSGKNSTNLPVPQCKCFIAKGSSNFCYWFLTPICMTFVSDSLEQCMHFNLHLASGTTKAIYIYNLIHVHKWVQAFTNNENLETWQRTIRFQFLTEITFSRFKTLTVPPLM